PGQAGRTVPTLLTAIPALPRGGTTASVACLQIVLARRGVARLGWHRAGGRRRRIALWRDSAAPRAGIAPRPGDGELKALAEPPQRHRPGALPPLAVAHKRGAAGRRIARAHPQPRAAAVLLERLARLCDGDERAVAQPPDAARRIASDPAAKRRVFRRARIGI